MPTFGLRYALNGVEIPWFGLRIATGAAGGLKTGRSQFYSKVICCYTCRAMDPVIRQLFEIEMDAPRDEAANQPARFIYPPSCDEQRRMRYHYVQGVRMWRDVQKLERQLQHKFAQTWTAVLEYLGGYFKLLQKLNWVAWVPASTN